MTDAPLDAVFVYGTLKQGFCRAARWPSDPLAIRPAWVWGALFDRHDYPAITEGEDRVTGELWRFTNAAMDEVVTTLDRIEGTNQPGQPDLYRRVVVDVFDESDQPLGRAFVYRYACDPTEHGFQPVRATPPDRRVGWPVK
jgi:gamma-glutamylcyclotransferase (GGCT)/AIG2-like uncharacterized protein YtfP